MKNLYKRKIYMTKVFIYNLNGVEFFVREEQRGALNEALEAKGQAKCEAEHFDFRRPL
jgi:hypothetical protein